MKIAGLFFANIFKFHGLPRSIVCDRNPIFISKFWQELYRLQGTSFDLNSSYHLQTDGQSEPVNRCLKIYLRCFTRQSPTNWVKWLPWVEFCNNTSWHSSIKSTPFQVAYIRLMSSYINGVYTRNNTNSGSR